jgi:predicted nucleotidyltransferase
MLLDRINQQKDQIRALSQQFGARRIRVFGSVARREEKVDSDVDFLVDFPMGYDLFQQRLPLAESLKELVGCEVDVIPEHELNRHIRNRVLQEAIDL